MKRTLLVPILLGAVLMAVCSTNVNAAAILVIMDTSGGGPMSCDTSLPIGPGNCGAGFTAVFGGNSIVFSGTVGGFSIGSISVNGNQPGNTTAGNVLDSKFNILHTSGTGNLQVDFGGNNFSLPAGPGLFLSASTTGNWGQATPGDQMQFIAWGRATNDFVIPGGTATAVAPVCAPTAFPLTDPCSTSTADVPFIRGAGNYALTGRQTITQSTSDTLAASYTATIAANAQPSTVPEPASVLLLGTGLLLVVFNRRLWK